MNEHDDHVIPYEEAVRRHRAIQEAQRRGKGVIHEVKMSDAMSHLLGEEQASAEEGPSPDQLRRIVEREFTDEGGRSEPEARPRPRLVEAPQEEPMGQVCSFETRVCKDVARTPETPPRH